MFPLLSTRQRAILEDEGGVDFAHIVFDGDGWRPDSASTSSASAASSAWSPVA